MALNLKAPILKEFAEKNYNYFYNNNKFQKTMKNEFVEKDLTELAVLYGDFNYSFSLKKNIQLKIIEKNLKEKHGLTFEEFVEKTTGKKLIYKQNIENQKEQEFQLFLEKIKQINPAFVDILPTPTLKQYKENEDLESFRFVNKLLKNLPTKPTYLPYFANKFTSNPHALDDNQPMTHLLQTMLAAQTNMADTNIYQAETERKNELFAKNNLIRDDIMNNVCFQNLLGQKNNQIVWSELYDQHTIWFATVKELLSIQKIITKYNFVIMIENSSVFSRLTEVFPELPIICSAGQPNYAVWLLLRKLDSNTTIYYSGDLDHNGLVIANNFYKAFPNQIQYLGMTKKVLLTHQEIYTKKFNDSQNKKISQLNPMLQDIGKIIIDKNVKAMQESFTNEIIEAINHIHGDLRSMLSHAT